MYTNCNLSFLEVYNFTDFSENGRSADFKIKTYRHTYIIRNVSKNDSRTPRLKSKHRSLSLEERRTVHCLPL